MKVHICILLPALALVMSQDLVFADSSQANADVAQSEKALSVEEQAEAAYQTYSKRMHQVTLLMKEMKKPEELRSIRKKIRLLLGHYVPAGEECPYPSDPAVQLELIKILDRKERNWYSGLKTQCRRVMKLSARSFKKGNTKTGIKIELAAHDLMHECTNLPFVLEWYRRDKNHPVLKKWYKNKPLFRGY